MAIKKGLGKGINALIAPNKDEENEKNNILEVELTKLMPGTAQPRKSFESKYIEELALSIKSLGIIQPIVVKKENESFIIVAGERRFRAAKLLNLEKVPIIIKDYSLLQSLEVALIENIQREDLNPIEEAQTYKRLSQEFGLTQETIAKKVGKSRSHIANIMRLLNLNEQTLPYVSKGLLSIGHAKAILSIEDNQKQHEIAKLCIEENLNVRETEAFIKEYLNPTPPKDPSIASNLDLLSGYSYLEAPQKDSEENATDNTQDNIETQSKLQEPPATPKNPRYNSYQSQLQNILGTRVNIKDTKIGKEGGKIEIKYFSLEDLQRIIDIIKTP